MKRITVLLLALISLGSCSRNSQKLDTLLENYWEDYLYYHPIEATGYGVATYNNVIRNTFSDTFRASMDSFYQHYLEMLDDINYDNLDQNDKISYDILKREIQFGQEYLKLPNQYLPINQFDALPLTFAMLGSGAGSQPFETKEDYENFLERMDDFYDWTQTAINRMREGVTKDIVLPRELVNKMVDQYQNFLTADAENSHFFEPCNNFPKDFSESTQEELAKLYKDKITEKVTPAYKSLREYLLNEYSPSARETDGYYALPDGINWYEFWVRKWTTTNMSPEEIYNIGTQEVEYLRSEMEKVMSSVEFKGSLKDFFHFCNTDAQFRPFTTVDEVLDSFRNVQKTEDPHLNEMFALVPKTKFEIRQTEKFREATASAEYQPASEDGSRPGIFYCPIPDATKFNAIGMETLFLHEAIPGHHYQISLQQENKSLPQFRKFLWYGAYGEGWALYSESLGNDLGLFQNPYQYFGHLSDAMLRAVRLVVDVGLHTGKMTREEAIQFMLENMRTTPEEATQEIERYMAIPGQALSYMIGKKKLIQLRQKTEKRLGDKFEIKKFHDAVLAHGCVPLETLEQIVADIK